MVPVAIEPVVRHLQYAADIGGLVLVEEEIGVRRITVDAILSLQKAQGDECIQEVPGGARVQTETSLDCSEILRVLGQLGEDFHFYGAQENLRGPKAHTDLHDLIRRCARFFSFTQFIHNYSCLQPAVGNFSLTS